MTGDPTGTVRVHPDDDPHDPTARRVIRTDRDCGLPWVLITGLESGRPGADWRSRSDSEIGLGPATNGARLWPHQPLTDLRAVLDAGDRRTGGRR